MRIRGISAAGLTATLLVIMVAPPTAQTPDVAGRAQSQPPQAARSSAAVVATTVEHIDLLVGRSTVLRMERPITRVSLPKPDVADALVTSPNELLVHGKAPGTISLLVWGEGGQIKTYDVSVRRDLSDLEKQVRELFPGERIAVSSNGSDVVLSGVVSSKYIVEKASSLATGYVEKATNVVNLLRQQEGIASNQILLQVRFAEVSRTAMQELGVSFFTGLNGSHGWVGRTATQQFPAPTFDDKGLVFSDFLNLFVFNTKEQIGAVVKALQTKGLFQSLAEPNLVTQNGKEASFLAGGEFPIPVVQGSGLNSAVTIMFKEFGVRLRFTPTVVGDDLIQLKVAPEVSALDFANAVSIQGFRVPALSTRRTETEVELRDGQTFAVAGLIDNTVTQTMSKIPGIGDIPILGTLFKSRAYQKNATELVVMITPHIVRRDSTGVTSNLPGLVQPFLPQDPRIPQPPPAFVTPGRPPSGNESKPGVRDEQSRTDDRDNENATRKADAARTREAAKADAVKMREAAKADAARQAKEAAEAAKADAARQAKEAAEAAKADAARQAKEAAEARETARVEGERRQEESRQAAHAQKEAEARGRKQAEIDRKQAQEDQKNAEVARREEEVRSKARAQREAREAGEAAARERVRLEEERRQAAERRQADEQLANERAALDAEFAKRAAKLEEARAAQERAQEEERRKADEKRAKERTKRQTATNKALSTDLSRIGPSPTGHDIR